MRPAWSSARLAALAVAAGLALAGPAMAQIAVTAQTAQASSGAQAFRGGLGSTAAATATASTAAPDLLALWQAAWSHDPQAAALQAARAAGQTGRAQAAALWRPQLMVTAGAGLAGQDTSTTGARFAAPGFGSVPGGVDFATSVNSGLATQLAVSAALPLYSPQRRADGLALTLAAEQAEAAWADGRQTLMLRTAERAQALALAVEGLRVQQAQLRAVALAAAEAQDRYTLGASPITDTHEARARLAGLQAQVLAAQTALALQRQPLADSTGLDADSLRTGLPRPGPEESAPPGPPAAAPAAAPAGAGPAAPGVADVDAPEATPLDDWLARAEAQHPGLRRQQLALDAARSQAQRQRAGAGTQLDLVAAVSREHLGGSGDLGHAQNAAGNRQIGLRLSVPIDLGGGRDAREQQAQRQVEQAQAELAGARQQVAQRVRALWLGLRLGAQRITALAQAVAAGRARLDATELGRTVGHRTTLDALNARNDLAAAELALAQARSERWLDRLRLQAAAGVLDEPQLQAAGAQLMAPAAP